MRRRAAVALATSEWFVERKHVELATWMWKQRLAAWLVTLAEPPPKQLPENGTSCHRFVGGYLCSTCTRLVRVIGRSHPVLNRAVRVGLLDAAFRFGVTVADAYLSSKR